MKIVRLENTLYNGTSETEELIDKILLYDSSSGALEVISLKKPIRCPFTQEIGTEELIEVFEVQLDQSPIRIVRNKPVVGSYSAPFKVYIDLNLNCSLKCSFCLSDSGKNRKTSLDFKTVEKIAEELKALGVFYVKLGGGDPFLYPDIRKVISLLRTSGCFVSISTNSTTITPSLAKFLSGQGVKVSVSLEGMQEVNDSLRGLGQYERSLEALKMLKEAGADVMIRSTLFRQTLKDVGSLIELAKEHGVKVKFSYCRPAGRAVANQMMLTHLDAKDYLKALENIHQPENLPFVLLDEGMMFTQPQSVVKKLFQGRMCGAANRSMHIDAHGQVSPCVFFGPEFSFGKIYTDGDLADFWQGKVGDKFRRVRAIEQPKNCDSCDRICKNECPANRLYFWQDFSKQDPNCLKEVRRNVILSDTLEVGDEERKK